MNEQPTWRLTRRQVDEIVDNNQDVVLWCEWVELGADAQAKRLVEWGMEMCAVHPNSHGRTRFECFWCTEYLRREVGLP